MVGTLTPCKGLILFTSKLLVQNRTVVSITLVPVFKHDTVFSRLNAGSVYLKLGLVDPAFIRTRRLFGVRRLFIKCIFQLSFFYHQYWRLIELRTKFQ